MADLDLIVGGGPAGMMAGLLFARAGVHGAGARKARRLLPRFPRRHGPPLDDGDPRPARAARALPRAAARPARHGRDPDRRARLDDRRPVAPRHAGAVHRDDAAMGFPRFPARRGGGFPGFSPRDGGAGRRASSRRTGGSPACGSPTARSFARQLTIAADGRASLVRAEPAAGRRPRRADGRVLVPPAKRRTRRASLRGTVEPGRLVVLIDRGDYWQCAFLIPKGAAEDYQGAGHRRDPRAKSPRPFPELDLARARRDRPTCTC